MMFPRKTVFAKTAFALSALVIALGAQPAHAAGGVTGALGATLNGTLGTTLGHNGAAGALKTGTALDGTLKAAGNTLNAATAATATGKGVFNTPAKQGILASATGAVGADGKVKSLDLFGDDMIKVNVAEDKATAATKANGGIALDANRIVPADTKRVALGEANANALLGNAVQLKGIDRAESVIVKEDGTVILGASSANGKTSASVKADEAVSVKTPDVKKEARALEQRVEDRLEKTASRVPVTANGDKDHIRVASSLPRGGEAEARAAR